jgi:hypothetical protein
MRRIICLPLLVLLASCYSPTSPTTESNSTSAAQRKAPRKAGASKQTLLFIKELMPQVKSGEKQISIRRGKQTYKPGQRIIGRCSGEEGIPLEVTECKQLPLREVPPQDLKDDGFQSAEDVLTFFRRWYGDMNLDSTVTVVRFRKWGDKQKTPVAPDAAATAVPTVVEPQ